MSSRRIDELLATLKQRGTPGSAEGLPLGLADQLRAPLLAESLRDFIPQAWPIIDSAPYKSGWHIDAVADHLEAVSRGEIQRLVINVPPRHCKSSIVSVIWPAWEWLSTPSVQWLFASYAERLSKRDSLKCRRLIQSRGGRRQGGTLLERVGYVGLLALLGQDWELARDQSEKFRFENTATGYRLATSVGGTATGEGGDRIVIDDPHKADEVESDVTRKNVLDWLDGTMSTRLNDPAKGSVVLIMQRLHESDLTGHMLAQGDCEHLCLPAEYEPSHPFMWPDDPRSEPGELLWPAHFDRGEVDRLKRALGSYRAAGQLQQLPAPAAGGIFKNAWWAYYPASWLEDLERAVQSGEYLAESPWPGPRIDRIWQSWDTALKDKTTSDYTVGQLWGQAGADSYLLRQVRGRWSLGEAISQATALTAWAGERFPRFTSHGIYVENTANGPEIISALRKRVSGVIPVKPDRDKVTRAHAVTPQLEAGNVRVPGDRTLTPDGFRPDPHLTPSWVQELVAECAAFPRSAHDDQVDALTQALDPRRQRNTGHGAATARHGRGRSLAGQAVDSVAGEGDGGAITYTNAEEYEVKARQASRRRNLSGGGERWKAWDV
jgi:predicted phage terminase large subunit-like protein